MLTKKHFQAANERYYAGKVLNVRATLDRCPVQLVQVAYPTSPNVIVVGTKVYLIYPLPNRILTIVL